MIQFEGLSPPKPPVATGLAARRFDSFCCFNSYLYLSSEG